MLDPTLRFRMLDNLLLKCDSHATAYSRTNQFGEHEELEGDRVYDDV